MVGNEELVFNGYRVLIWEDEIVLEMDGGEGCRAMYEYLYIIN